MHLYNYVKYVYLCILASAHVHECVHTCVHVCMGACVIACTRVYVHMYMCTLRTCNVIVYSCTCYENACEKHTVILGRSATGLLGIQNVWLHTVPGEL